jgi:proteasome lid subunit RPN8/RPN11
VAKAAKDVIVAHARRERPRECCGILLGRHGAILEAKPVRNIAASVHRFLLDPRDHIEIRRQSRRRGLEIVGFYHSHPASSAEPSPTDAAEIAYPESLHAIVSLTGEEPALRLFRWEDDRFVEVETDWPAGS